MNYEKRRIVIRESDIANINNVNRFSNRRFYSAVNEWRLVSVEPVTQAWCEKQISWFSLKNKQQMVRLWRHWPWPNELLSRLGTGVLWDRRYARWLVRWTDAETLEIRATLNQPRSRLMWATIERGMGGRAKTGK